MKEKLVSAEFQNDAVMKLLAYRVKDKLVKKSARSDKRIFLESKAAEAEMAAKKGDSKIVYKITDEIIGKWQKTDCPVKDKKKRIVTEEKEIENVWANHFESVLKCPELINPISILETPLLIVGINTDTLRESEIISVLKKLRNGRALGNA